MKLKSTFLSLLATAILCVFLVSCDRTPAQDSSSVSTSPQEETASIREAFTDSSEKTPTDANTSVITVHNTETTAKPDSSVTPTGTTTASPSTTVPVTNPATTAAPTVAETTTAPVPTTVPTTVPVATTTPNTERVTDIITDSEDGSIELTVTNLVNKHRVAQGLSPLTYSPELSAAANIRAKEIVSNFSHTRPDGSLWYTAGTGILGENIAKNYDTADRVMDAWMNSEGHRKNILTPDYTKIGIGCYYDSNTDMYYWVQLFG